MPLISLKYRVGYILIFASVLLMAATYASVKLIAGKEEETERFQIASGSQGTAWKINTKTGEVTYCYVDFTTQHFPFCKQEIVIGK